MFKSEVSDLSLESWVVFREKSVAVLRQENIVKNSDIT